MLQLDKKGRDGPPATRSSLTRHKDEGTPAPVMLILFFNVSQ